MYTKGSEELFKKTKSSRGFAIIYVIIIMVPLLFVSASVLDLVSTNFHAENIVERGAQAKYNAELGIKYGIKMLQAGRYTTDYDYDTAYLIFDNAESNKTSKSYTSITIKQGMIYKSYIISSEGFYMGVKNVIEKSIDKKLLMNMSRKFTAVKIAVLSETDFQVSINNLSIRLPEMSRFLILKDDFEPQPNIKLFSNNSGEREWLSSSEAFFIKSSIDHDKLWDILTPNGFRKMWKKSGDSIMYYVSEKGKNITLDLNSIESLNDEIYKGFREYSQDTNKEGTIPNNNIRLMLIDGDLTLRDIRGDYGNQNTTMSQRYLNNIVIYCKGKLTIDNCVLAAYDNQKNLVDLNMALIAEEVEFKLSNESIGNITEISYLDGNKGLLLTNESQLVDLIRQNTTDYSDWWI